MNKTGLIVRDTRGETVGVVLSNEKSRTKTLERGELWVVDPTTGRVLPYLGGGAAPQGGFVKRESWYEIAIAAAPGPSVDGGPSRSTQKKPEGGTPFDGEAGSPDETGTTAERQNPDASRMGRVLSHLTAVIAERHRTMPEGSYTTHLFSQGRSKIRKKTGEEAVELILAADAAELTSEAADLLYHLMVLLESESLTIADVIDVLAKRTLP